jgi:hypothetical protein
MSEQDYPRLVSSMVQSVGHHHHGNSDDDAGLPIRTRSHDHTRQWHSPGTALFNKGDKKNRIIATIEVCYWH